MPISSFLAPSAIARLCPDCQTDQPLSNYTIRKDGKVAAYCKPCNAKRTAAYRANNRERYLQNKRQQRVKRNAKFSARAIKARWDNMTAEERQEIGCGVYTVTVGSKFYVGATTCFTARMEEHLHKLRCRTHPNKHFQAEFDAHGYFDAELIDPCDPDNLHSLESKYLSEWHGHEDCINIVSKPGKNPRLADEVVTDVRARHAAEESQASISRSLGISPFLVFSIVHYMGRYKEESLADF